MFTIHRSTCSSCADMKPYWTGLLFTYLDLIFLCGADPESASSHMGSVSATLCSIVIRYSDCSGGKYLGVSTGPHPWPTALVKCLMCMNDLLQFCALFTKYQIAFHVCSKSYPVEYSVDFTGQN